MYKQYRKLRAMLRAPYDVMALQYVDVQFPIDRYIMQIYLLQ